LTSACRASNSTAVYTKFGTPSKPDRAQQYIDDLAQLNITWAAPTVAYALAIKLARQLDHHLFDTLYHAVALSIPGAVLITADRRYFVKAQHLGQLVWLADFSLG